ncbi:MAG: hypothetical protein J6T40_02050 [Clostridiales bacterium]|nr:hypothetical protein [Clostridiales bacterium]
MHALIINGSPRVKKYSNTDKILLKFTEGMAGSGSTFEQYEISDCLQWEKIRKAFSENENILIALPLYVENIPGLLLEFLSTVEPRNGEAKMSFILQSGFAEGCQLRCGEAYLEKLAGRLGCSYGGTLVKGDNFSIRLFEGEQREKVTGRYTAMGRIYGRDGNFSDPACKAFTGPEVFPLPIRLLVGLMMKTLAKRGFDKAAKGWGCERPLGDRPYAVR